MFLLLLFGSSAFTLQDILVGDYNILLSNMPRATTDHRRKSVTSVTDQINRLSKSRAFALMNDIDGDHFCESRIVRPQA